MAYDMGIFASMLVKTESTYGTAPGGDWEKVHFVSSAISKKQAFIPSDVLGQGRDPTDPTLGGINVDGQLAVPLCNNQMGFWFKQLLGAPVTTGATNYTHTFKSGSVTLPSFSVQVYTPNIPRYRTSKGCVAGEITLELGRDNLPTARLMVIGQDEEVDGVARDTTPATSMALSRFHAFVGSVSKNATPLADVLSATFTYRNGLDPVAPIRSDGLIDAVVPGQSAFEMSLRCRVKDTTLLSAVGATPVDIDFGYTTGVNNSLMFNLPRVFMPDPEESISGPGGIEVTFTGIGAYNSGISAMMEVVLKNQIASYATY